MILQNKAITRLKINNERTYKSKKRWMNELLDIYSLDTEGSEEDQYELTYYQFIKELIKFEYIHILYMEES